VISVLYARITLTVPIFSLIYYIANWIFVFVFFLVLAHCILFQQRQELVNTKEQDLNDEEVSLLHFT
jgi:hypothetical protein